MLIGNFSPLEGSVIGDLPSWLSGSLLMNGPGRFHYGRQVVGHLFDGSALLQRYAVDKGRAYYLCRYNWLSFLSS